MADMSQIIESIDVDVPVRTAYNQWTQFEQFPRFLEHIESITQQDDTHALLAGEHRRPGARVRRRNHRTAPDERVAWNSTGGDVDHAGVVTFHKLSDGQTRVTVQLDWEPQGLLEKLGSVTGVSTHAVKDELQQLKTYIEQQGTEDGAWRGDVLNPELRRRCRGQSSAAVGQRRPETQPHRRPRRTSPRHRHRWLRLLSISSKVAPPPLPRRPSGSQF